MKKITLNCFIQSKQLKLYLALMCGSLLISSCGGGPVKKEKTNDWVAMGLKGQVQKMTETKPKAGISDFYTFNEKGYLDEKGVKTGWPANKTVVTERYEYGTDGKLSSISYFSNISGELKSKQIYENDLLIEEQKFSTTNFGSNPEYEVTSTTSYIYDSNSLLVKKQTGDDDKNRSEFECDAAGNILKSISYFNGRASTCGKTDYEYDSHGNITRYAIYNRENFEQSREEDGELSYVEECKYDNDSRLTEQSNITYLYNSGKKKNEISQKKVFTYQYDEQGNVMENSCVTYKYKEGKELEPGAPAVTTYVYVYDKHGNWTSKETKYNGNTQETLTRKYVYFGEEAPKFAVEDLVGAWDYYAETDPSNKIEMVFKKDGTLIDYIDFHSTGTYKINPEGTIITMQFTYNDGDESQTSKPFDYTIMEYTGDKLRLQFNGGKIICYDRKAKSINYDGEL